MPDKLGMHGEQRLALPPVVGVVLSSSLNLLSHKVAPVHEDLDGVAGSELRLAQMFHVAFVLPEPKLAPVAQVFVQYTVGLVGIHEVLKKKNKECYQKNIMQKLLKLPLLRQSLNYCSFSNLLFELSSYSLSNKA